MGPPHPDKMTFLEHLEERASASCARASTWPRRRLLGLPRAVFHFMVEPMRKAGLGQVHLHRPGRALMLYMKMSFFVGIFVVAPFILWEIWNFISPGLSSTKEVGGAVHRHGHRSSSPGSALFGHYVMFPMTFSSSTPSAARTCSSCRASYWEFYSLVPARARARGSRSVVIFVLARRPGDADGPLRVWKWAVLGSFIVSAVVTLARRRQPDGARGPMIGPSTCWACSWRGCSAGRAPRKTEPQPPFASSEDGMGGL